MKICPVETELFHVDGRTYVRSYTHEEGIRLFLSQTFSRMDILTILKFSHYLPTCLWRWNRQSVPKRRNI